MNEWQKKEMESATPLYKGVMEKAFTKKASPRAAIKAFCLHCVGYERNEVTNCTSLGCPLWHYRPYQDSAGLAEVSE